MKNILIIMATIGLLCGCTSTQQKAENVIKSYIANTIDNPKSYESIEFSELYTDYHMSQFDDSKYNEQLKQYAKERNDLILAGDNAGATQILNKISELNKEIEEARNSFIPKEEIGLYYIIHKFRASNQYGALTKYCYMYTIDKQMQEVIHSEEITERWIELLDFQKSIGIITDEQYDWTQNALGI